MPAASNETEAIPCHMKSVFSKQWVNEALCLAVVISSLRYAYMLIYKYSAQTTQVKLYFGPSPPCGVVQVMSWSGTLISHVLQWTQLPCCQYPVLFHNRIEATYF